MILDSSVFQPKRNELKAMTVSRIRKEGISWIILFPIRLIRQLAGYSRIPARFSACNNKFSLDAALSTAHNWRQRGEGAVDGWSSPPKRPSSTTSVSPRLSISSHSLCTPWLHGPGAILGCVWIGTRGCACSPLHPLPPFSIYLSLPIHSRSRLHTRAHRYTLSLSLSLLRWSSVSVRRVGTSGASMIPSRSSQPMLALPCFVQHRSNRVLFGPPVPSPRFGRRGKRFMGGGWPEKLGETGKKELPILGNDVSPWDIFCAHPPPLGSRRASPRESGGFHTWMINLGRARNFGVNGIGF